MTWRDWSEQAWVCDARCVCCTMSQDSAVHGASAGRKSVRRPLAGARKEGDEGGGSGSVCSLYIFPGLVYGARHQGYSNRHTQIGQSGGVGVKVCRPTSGACRHDVLGGRNRSRRRSSPAARHDYREPSQLSSRTAMDQWHVICWSDFLRLEAAACPATHSNTASPSR